MKITNIQTTIRKQNMFDQSRFSTRCFYMAERKNAEPAKFHKKVEKPTRGALLRRRHYTILNQDYQK